MIVANQEHNAIQKVEMQDSSKQNLLQLADMVVGAIARTLTTKTDAAVYRAAI